MKSGSTKCRVCESEAKFLFKSLVLNKYEVSYYKCQNCEFIQTEKPYWLSEAYGDAIADLDVGLVSRNLSLVSKAERIIKNNFNLEKKFLDYAGGYGMFVRLMRDKGFDFYREDRYCQNIFAKYFDVSGLPGESLFELVTAIEVFEHLENPISEIRKILEYSDNVLFTTELIPRINIKNINDWWYFVPETGQHISFYSVKTLKYISDKLGLNFFTDGKSLHIFTKKNFENNPLEFEDNNGNALLKSLLQNDFELAKDITKKIEILKKDNAVLTGNSGYYNALKDKALLLLKIDQIERSFELEKNEHYKTRSELKSLSLELEHVKNELNTIRVSREWRTILFLQKMVKIFIPKNSIRRKTAVVAWRFLKLITRFLFKAIRKIRSLMLFWDIYLLKFKPRKKRRINKESKKIVYIGHSYHSKTKSTAFLVDYLKEFYDVEVVLDESWNNGVYPNLSFIDRSYLGVVFFQLLPDMEILKNIENDNLIYFPMYDQSGRLEFDFWYKYRNIKIINFSRTLHGKFAKWGFESMFVQYFPNLQDFISGNKDEVFFWQRLTGFGIDVISKLFGKDDVKMHIHKAIDPAQEFQQPTIEQEKKFKITYSDWFETKNEMWNVIKQKGFYIAPREYEGIGMSFLEAMAMGKAVVAVDNPTMNEYIEHGKNGYLFDLKNPKKIDFSNMEEVQKNTYEFMRAGYEKWENDKKKIIDFIEKP